MTCRACGSTIADKAIVCYRCGAPTAETAAPARRPSGRRRVWPVVLVMVVTVVAAVVWWLSGSGFIPAR